MRTPESLLEVRAKRPIIIEDPERQLIGKGSRSRVFGISPHRAVKVDMYDDPKFIDAEIILQHGLWKSGIRVPRPYGRFPVRLGDEIRTGFVMERVRGPSLDKGDAPRGLFIGAGRRELSKAMKLGFEPRDSGPSNMVYNENNGKVYIIDVAHWLVRSDHPLAKILPDFKIS